MESLQIIDFFQQPVTGTTEMRTEKRHTADNEIHLAGAKLLAIDYGLARTGIAITDAGGRMAFPHRTIHTPPQTSRQAFFEKLLACIDAETPAALIVGLPLHADGSESMTTRQVRNFVERLKRRTPLPVYLMPELLSSEAASNDLRACGLTNAHSKKRKTIKAVLDQQAAVHILQSFLADTQQQKRRV